MKERRSVATLAALLASLYMTATGVVVNSETPKDGVAENENVKSVVESTLAPRPVGLNKVEVLERNPDGFKLKWPKPDTHGVGIDFYVVAVDGKQVVWPATRHQTITGLDSNTVYDVSVSVKTTEGQYTGTSIKVRTGSAPPPPPAPPVEEEPAKEQSKPAWVNPMPGAAFTSGYGPRGGALHAGMDLAAPPGTPVKSVGAGTVTHVGWVFGGYGISVVVDHGNGYQTHYAHLSGTNVSAGQKVSAGHHVGYEGSTGDSTGPHLHFEVHQGLWNQVEPTGWLEARGAW